MSTPTTYNNAKTVIIVVQCDKNYTTLMCTCPVATAVSLLALTISCDHSTPFPIKESFLLRKKRCCAQVCVETHSFQSAEGMLFNSFPFQVWYCMFIELHCLTTLSIG